MNPIFGIPVDAGSGEVAISLDESRPRITVVIPAKNEAKNIGWVIGRLPPLVDELVLVDGSSDDATIEVARALWPDVVVVQDEQPGKGAALRAGFAAATGDYVVMIDADGSMDPAEIPSFIDQLNQGSDLVKGSRFMAGGGSADISILRMLGNRVLLAVANSMFGSSCSELCYGYAAFRRTVIASLGLTAIGFEIETQLFLRAIHHGLRVDEVPSFEAPRRSGVSNLNVVRDGWRVLKTILSERRRDRSRATILARPHGFPFEAAGQMSVPVGAGRLAVPAQAEQSVD